MRIGLMCALVFATACGDNLGGSPDGGGGDDGAGGTTPRVLSSTPGSGETGVAINSSAGVTFSEPMDRATLTSGVFTVTAGGVAVTGTVIATATTAVFWPAARLPINTELTATIGVAAKSANHVALAAPHTWKFTTGTVVAPGLAVGLGTSGDFVLLAKSGIVNVPTSLIRGNLGVSPITSTAITGFPLTPDPSLQFSTTPEVTGRVYAPDFASPSPAMLTTAISDMELAFTDAAGRAPDVTELGAGTIGTVTLVPGVYKWSTALNITTNVTLNGSATDVWIFEIAQGLTISSGIRIVLAGGALPKNIFWQASGQVIVNTGAHLEGNVLTLTQATLDTGASLNGRLLAQTQVTVRGATITQPAP